MNDRSYTSYFIVGTQRSGTTVTHHCLRGHPHVSALKEELAFSPFFTEGMATFTFGRPGTEAEQSGGRRSLFHALTEAERTSDTLACGVKCAFGHAGQTRRFVEVLQSEFPNARVIHVVRNDQVAQFGSRLKARSTRVYHQTADPGTNAETPTLELDRHRFAEHMLAIHEANAVLRSLEDSHDVLRIDYERDILNGEIRENRDLFAFVDVDPQPATWLQHRKVSPPPDTYIPNYAALRDLQHEIERQIDSGASFDELRAEYRPPLLKHVLQTGKHWIEHPGYAAYTIGRSIRSVLSTSDDAS